MNRSKSTYRSRMTQRTSTALLITKTTRDAITTYRVVDVFPLSCTEIAILHHGTFNFLSDKKYFSKQSLNSGHQDITKSICVITPDFPFLKKMYLPSTLLPSIHFCNRPYKLRLCDGKYQTYGKMNCIFADNQYHIFQVHKSLCIGIHKILDHIHSYRSR